MLFLRQSSSQQVLIGPFIDDTDGATPETALTIANTDIRLSKNGAVIVAKNSGGGTHREAGWYAIVLNPTDSDTVGLLQLHVKVAGALMVHAEFQVLEEIVYDALFTSAAAGELAVKLSAQGKLDVNAEADTALTDYGGPTNAEMIARTLVAAAYFDPAVDPVTVGTNNDKTGYSLSAAGIQAIWDALTSALITAGSIGKLLADNINATISSRLASASITLTAGKVTVGTNEDKTGYAISGTKTTLDALQDVSAAQVNAEVDAALNTAIPVTPTADSLNERVKRIEEDITPARAGNLDNLDATISSRSSHGDPDPSGFLDAAVSSRATPAQVNTEVSDVLKTDTVALPGQAAPSNTPTMETILGWLYKTLRNKKEQTATEWRLLNDAETAVDAKATVSDDGTTSTKGKIVSGP